MLLRKNRCAKEERLRWVWQLRLFCRLINGNALLWHHLHHLYCRITHHFLGLKLNFAFHAIGKLWKFINFSYFHLMIFQVSWLVTIWITSIGESIVLSEFWINFHYSKFFFLWKLCKIICWKVLLHFLNGILLISIKATKVRLKFSTIQTFSKLFSKVLFNKLSSSISSHFHH